MQLISLEVMGRSLNNVSSQVSREVNAVFTDLLAQALRKIAQTETNIQADAIAAAPKAAVSMSNTGELRGTGYSQEPVRLAPAPEVLPPSKRYDSLIAAAGQKYGIKPAILKALIKTESNFDEAARSRAGAVGLTQMMPQTARSLGVNPLNPAEAIEGGAKYLGQMLHRYNGNVEMALAAYNAGPGSVDRYGGIPPYRETHYFIQKVKQHSAAFQNDF